MKCAKIPNFYQQIEVKFGKINVLICSDRILVERLFFCNSIWQQCAIRYLPKNKKNSLFFLRRHAGSKSLLNNRIVGEFYHIQTEWNSALQI